MIIVSGYKKGLDFHLSLFCTRGGNRTHTTEVTGF